MYWNSLDSGQNGNSGHGETVVSILIEFQKFWAYENREAMVVESTNEEPQQQQQQTQTVQPEAVAEPIIWTKTPLYGSIVLSLISTYIPSVYEYMHFVYVS